MKLLSPNQQQIFKQSKDQDLEVWSLPTVESEQVVDDEKTNAMGVRTNWRYEPPEEIETLAPEPLTAEAIEEIRQAAYEEGFSQGKEEGFATGYEEGKSAGHQEGLNQGHEEGYGVGYETGKAAIDELAKQWQSLIETLHRPMANIEKNVEEQLLHLVVQLTQAVTLQEAKINPDILTTAIGLGIKALPSQEAKTQILVHPDDIKLVEQQFGEAYILEQGWRLLAAPQLAPGSCQIENSTCNIDLSIKTRLKEVLDSFLQDALHQ